MQSVANAEAAIVADFEWFETWAEKYQYIIELGQKLPAMDGVFQTDDYKIKGCQSSVWLHCKIENGLLFFEADSDSTFVKGLVSLLIQVLNGRPADEILGATLTFIDAIGLRQHLAQTRANGLASMIKQIKTYALAYSSQVQ
ncbi:MAG: SufE family protein [Bacteroidia bacterium]|nr:SufE family protein [Bacteroidia bacterium]